MQIAKSCSRVRFSIRVVCFKIVFLTRTGHSNRQFGFGIVVKLTFFYRMTAGACKSQSLVPVFVFQFVWCASKSCFDSHRPLISPIRLWHRRKMDFFPQNDRRRVQVARLASPLDITMRPGRWHPYPSIFRPVKKWTIGCGLGGGTPIRPFFDQSKNGRIGVPQFIFRLQSECASHSPSSTPPLESKMCGPFSVFTAPPESRMCNSFSVFSQKVQRIFCLHCPPGVENVQPIFCLRCPPESK